MPNYEFACDISCLYVFIGTIMCKNDPKTHLVSTDRSLWTYKVPGSQVLGVSTWTSLGAIYPMYHTTVAFSASKGTGKRSRLPGLLLCEAGAEGHRVVLRFFLEGMPV